MNLEKTENVLVIRETPGCLWIFGLFFALVGGLFVYGALGGLADYALQPPWQLALFLLMGLVGVGAGGWIVYAAPVTKVVVDRRADSVLLRRYGLFGRRESVYAFDEVKEFCLLEERDDDGDPIFSLGMRLANDDTLKISSLPLHDARFKRNFVFEANDFMWKHVLPAQMILELEDETDAEMS